MLEILLSCHFFLSVWKRTSEDFRSLWEPGQVHYQARIAGQGDEKQAGRRDPKTSWFQQRPARHVQPHALALCLRLPYNWWPGYRSTLCPIVLEGPTTWGMGAQRAGLFLSHLQVVGCGVATLGLRNGGLCAWAHEREGVCVQLLLCFKSTSVSMANLFSKIKIKT